jgi:hypothetical protein
MAKRTRRVVERRHERAGARLIRRAIEGRWAIPDELLDSLPRVVAGLVANARTDRERLRAIELLVTMSRDNLAALQAADRLERLDDGLPTDNLQLGPISLRVGG